MGISSSTRVESRLLWLSLVLLEVSLVKFFRAGGMALNQVDIAFIDVFTDDAPLL